MATLIYKPKIIAAITVVSVLAISAGTYFAMKQLLPKGVSMASDSSSGRVATNDQKDALNGDAPKASNGDPKKTSNNSKDKLPKSDKSEGNTKTAKPQKPSSSPQPTKPNNPPDKPKPTPAPSPTPPSSGGSMVFPTVQTTGPRVSSFTSVNGGLQSTHDGQVISGYRVTGRLDIRHHNVTVRDTLIRGTGTYMITTSKNAAGDCPQNVRFEYIEIDGALAAENDIPIYSSCGNMSIDRAYVHNVGRSSRLTKNMSITNSYIYSDRTGDSGAHRGAVGINGGSNNVIKNNVLKCRGTGCSAAIPNYGDFSPVENLLIEHNLLATTGSYCAYGGSLSGKPYPHGSNIRFIDNHFSTEFFPTCGRYGPIQGFDNGVRGNVWRGNVWHETGQPLNL